MRVLAGRAAVCRDPGVDDLRPGAGRQVVSSNGDGVVPGLPDAPEDIVATSPTAASTKTILRIDVPPISRTRILVPAPPPWYPSRGGWREGVGGNIRPVRRSRSSRSG